MCFFHLSEKSLKLTSRIIEFLEDTLLTKLLLTNDSLVFFSTFFSLNKHHNKRQDVL